MPEPQAADAGNDLAYSLATDRSPSPATASVEPAAPDLPDRGYGVVPPPASLVPPAPVVTRPRRTRAEQSSLSPAVEDKEGSLPEWADRVLQIVRPGGPRRGHFGPTPLGRLRRLAYDVMYLVVTFVLGVFFPVRTTGGRCVPRRGGVLLVANHGSYYDPPLVGLTCPRYLRYIAMEGLFRFTPFRWLITTMGAIKLDRKAGPRAGLTATLDALKEEEVVLIFPEGTRTHSGEMQPLQGGIWLLVRRSKVPVVAVGLAGPYQAWPMSKLLPVPGPMWVHYEPVAADPSMSEAEGMAVIQETLTRAVALAAGRRARLKRWWPLPGAGEVFWDRR